MKDRQSPDTLVGMMKAIWENETSERSQEFYKQLGVEAYMRFVAVPLALVRHPIAMIRFGLIMGDKETQRKDIETLRSMPQPSFIRSRQRFEETPLQ